MINHIEIYVSDIGRSRAFYDLLLPKLDYQLYQVWEKGFSYRKGQHYLVFVQIKEQYADAVYHRCQVGLNHLAFSLPSWDALQTLKGQLVENAISLLNDERYPWAGGDDAYRLYVEDPDRIKLEFVAPKETGQTLPRLETAHLYLRQIELGDAPDIYDYAQHSNVAQLAGFPPNQSIEDVEAFITQNLAKTATDYSLRIFAIVDKTSDRVIGTINFNRHISRHILAMGYVLHPDYWGQGLMVEAARALLKWGFTALNLHKIEMTVYDYNKQSQSVAQKLGFTLEGRLRDHKRLGIIYYDSLLYGLLREEWQKRQEKYEKKFY